MQRDILLSLCKYLDLFSLSNLSRTSKYYNKIMKDENFWANLLSCSNEQTKAEFLAYTRVSNYAQRYAALMLNSRTKVICGVEKVKGVALSATVAGEIGDLATIQYYKAIGATKPLVYGLCKAERQNLASKLGIFDINDTELNVAIFRGFAAGNNIHLIKKNKREITDFVSVLFEACKYNSLQVAQFCLENVNEFSLPAFTIAFDSNYFDICDLFRKTYVNLSVAVALKNKEQFDYALDHHLMDTKQICSALIASGEMSDEYFARLKDRIDILMFLQTSKIDDKPSLLDFLLKRSLLKVESLNCEEFLHRKLFVLVLAKYKHPKLLYSLAALKQHHNAAFCLKIVRCYVPLATLIERFPDIPVLKTYLQQLNP